MPFRTLADFDASLGTQNPPAVDSVDTNGTDMYHPGLADTPGSAAAKELLRTGKEAAIGVARSPWDMLKGVLGLPKQVYTGLTESIPTLMRDPSLLKEAPAAAVQAVRDLGNNPRDAGSLLGQMLLAPKVPGGAETVLEKGPAIVGRGVSKLGRGVEATGKFTGVGGPGGMATRALTGELVGGHAGAAIAAGGPPVLEAVGRGLRRAGAATESADVLGGLRRAASRFQGPSEPPSPEPPPPAGYTPQSREVPGGTISDKMVEFMGPTEEGAKPPETGGFGTESTVPTREDLARQLLESPSFKGLQKAANKPATPARASSFSNEFGITDPEVARYADAGQDPLVFDFTEPDTARTLEEVSHPGAQRYIQSQHDLINGPGYESVRALLDELNNRPRATNYIAR